MQRTGRKGHAMFRVVVQDSRRTPTSGKIVALIGNYDPHSKTSNLEKEKAKFYIDHGAQPSPRVTRLLKTEGVKLPTWVVKPTKQTKKTRNIEKLRKNRPAEAKKPVEETVEDVKEEVVEAVAPEQTAAEEPATEEVSSTEEETTETPVEPEAEAEVEAEKDTEK
jgi:small subunit ribosomal protein S16